MAGILFVCTGNTCRSSMAAAIANHLQAERGLDIAVASAGMAAWEGAPATPAAVEAVAALGIDLRDHRARRVTAAMVAGADLVLTMEAAHRDRLQQLYPEAAGKIFTLKEYVRDRQPYPTAAAGRGQDSAGNAAAGPAGALDDDISDPIGQALDVYQDMARQLAGLIGSALEKFSQQSK